MRLSSEYTIKFDYLAPNTLETCISRLGSLQDLRENDPWVPQTRVNIKHLDDNTYAFILRERQPAPIEVRGYLNRLDATSTYISGEAKARVFLHGAELAFLTGLLIVLTIFIGIVVAILFAPPLAVFAWYTWRGAQRERDRMVRVIRDTLSKR